MSASARHIECGSEINPLPRAPPTAAKDVGLRYREGCMTTTQRYLFKPTTWKARQRYWASMILP